MADRIIKTFSLYPEHVATIMQVAKDGGRSSQSAGLRLIVDRFVDMSMRQNNLEAIARAYKSDLIPAGDAADELVKAVLESKAE